jgi:hypothetical protein
MFTTKQRGQGTGLGLVIVRQVMREHKGSIEVASVPEEGTRFRLIFPAVHDPLKRSNVLKSTSQLDREREAEAIAVTDGAPAYEAK